MENGYDDPLRNFGLLGGIGSSGNDSLSTNHDCALQQRQPKATQSSRESDNIPSSSATLAMQHNEVSCCEIRHWFIEGSLVTSSKLLYCLRSTVCS
jgi:hypothetical protein